MSTEAIADIAIIILSFAMVPQSCVVRSLRRQLEEAKAQAAKDSLNEEAVSLCRYYASKALGGNCAFVDDDAKLLAALAQRAVLAGLALDMPTNTLKNLRRAAENDRDVHEAALG